MKFYCNYSVKQWLTFKKSSQSFSLSLVILIFRSLQFSLWVSHSSRNYFHVLTNFFIQLITFIRKIFSVIIIFFIISVVELFNFWNGYFIQIGIILKFPQIFFPDFFYISITSYVYLAKFVGKYRPLVSNVWFMVKHLLGIHPKF